MKLLAVVTALVLALMLSGEVHATPATDFSAAENQLALYVQDETVQLVAARQGLLATELAQVLVNSRFVREGAARNGTTAEAVVADTFKALAQSGGTYPGTLRLARGTLPGVALQAPSTAFYTLPYLDVLRRLVEELLKKLVPGGSYEEKVAEWLSILIQRLMNNYDFGQAWELATSAFEDLKKALTEAATMAGDTGARMRAWVEAQWRRLTGSPDPTATPAPPPLLPPPPPALPADYLRWLNESNDRLLKLYPPVATIAHDSAQNHRIFYDENLMAQAKASIDPLRQAGESLRQEARTPDGLQALHMGWMGVGSDLVYIADELLAGIENINQTRLENARHRIFAADGKLEVLRAELLETNKRTGRS